MVDHGIHSVVVSSVRLFNGAELAALSGSVVAEELFAKVDKNRDFGSICVEIVTTGKNYFRFSGEIHGPVPAFDEIIPIKDFERSLKESSETTRFMFHASVRLSVTYPASEFADFLDAAEDEGIDHPNIFSWIQYCIDDAIDVISADIKSVPDLKPVLTIRGI